MKLKRKHLRQIIVEQLSKHQSELSYAKSKYAPSQSRKGLQKSFWKAHRGPGARSEIEMQLGNISTEDDRTIGEVVPIGPSGWSSLSGMPGPSGIPSEKEAYLLDLAYDLADDRVHMKDEDLDRLLSIAPHEFEMAINHAFDERRVQDDIADAAAGAEANLIGNLRNLAKKLDTDDLVPEEDQENYDAVYDALLQRGFSDVEIKNMVQQKDAE